MTNFRQPKKPAKQVRSIDGFIQRGATSSSRTSRIKSQFQTTYRPSRPLDGFQSQDDSFASRNQTQGFHHNAATATQLPSSSASDDQFSDQAFRSQDKSRTLSFMRKKKSNRSHRKRISLRKLSKAVAIMFVALIIGVSSLFAYGFIKARNIFKGEGEGAAALIQNVDPSRLNGEGDGRVNILLLGKGGPGETAPDLTDTLLLASIDPVQNETALVSVPRDMLVRNQFGGSTKINQVYADAKQARLANSNKNDADLQAAEDAGLSAVKRSVTEVLGIPVHYYVMVDFVAFENAINTVGGITVNVKEPLYDRTVAWMLGGNPLVAGEGLQTFDGKRALLYSRSRMGSARGDFDRTERQREIIVALQSKIFSLGTFSNPFKVVELMNTFGDRVRTDLNGLGEIKRLYEIGQNIGPDRIVSVGLADPPNILVRTDNINGLSVVVPSAGVYKYEDIRSFIRNTIRDPFLKQEDARIVILNGTDVVGLATATSTELKSYGYNVILVDNVPTADYVQNRLIDLTNGEKRYTKSYLQKRLGLTSETKTLAGLPTIEEADFVIILGTDEVNKATN
jgi:polyisoprenyl-teichoic acid--peptidoglycan teichoic acid transferase